MLFGGCRVSEASKLKRKTMNRTEALHQIITFGKQRDKAFTKLVNFSYDSDIEHFALEHKILADVLAMYINCSISGDDLEEWANFVECRDDINYLAVEDYIYALANPEIMGDISQTKINQMLIVLKEHL